MSPYRWYIRIYNYPHLCSWKVKVLSDDIFKVGPWANLAILCKNRVYYICCKLKYSDVICHIWPTTHVFSYFDLGINYCHGFNISHVILCDQTSESLKRNWSPWCWYFKRREGQFSSTIWDGWCNDWPRPGCLILTSTPCVWLLIAICLPKTYFLSLLCSLQSWVLPRWQCSWRLMDLYRLESDFTIEIWKCIVYLYLLEIFAIPHTRTIEHIFVAYD